MVIARINGTADIEMRRYQTATLDKTCVKYGIQLRIDHKFEPSRCNILQQRIAYPLTFLLQNCKNRMVYKFSVKLQDGCH